MRHTYFKYSFNTHISSAVSTHIFQALFQHTHFKYSFNAYISSTVSTHTHTHTHSESKNLKILQKLKTHKKNFTRSKNIATRGYQNEGAGGEAGIFADLGEVHVWNLALLI